MAALRWRACWLGSTSEPRSISSLQNLINCSSHFSGESVYAVEFVTVQAIKPVLVVNVPSAFTTLPCEST
jgi:hypothetical protein